MMRRPIPKQFLVARNLAVAIALVASVGPIKRALHNFAVSDALAELRLASLAPTPDYFIRLEGVKMRHYNETSMVSSATCTRVDMSQDRHTFEMNGVRDALYKGKQGEFHYEARHAIYNDLTSRLSADGNVRVRNKDMDLGSRAMEFNGNTNHLRIESQVTGKLKGGDLDVQHVDYEIDNGAYRAGPVSWKGPLALNLAQEPTDADKPSVWDIDGDGISYSGKDSQIANYTNAVATDGDVILLAPTVVHDRKTDVLTATGRIQYFSAKADLVADKCVIYRKEKRAVLTGNVLMLVKAKKDQDGKPKVEKLPSFQPLRPEQVVAAPPEKVDDKEKEKANQLRDSKTLREFPTVMCSDKIEYWYGKGSRHAVITGAPQGRQELPEGRWRHLWTHVAYYDGEKETLKLVSTKDQKDTRVKNSIGDNVVGDWMEVSTKEDDDQMTGYGFKAHFASLDDELPKDKKKSPPTDPPSGKPGDRSGDPKNPPPPKDAPGSSTGG